MAHVTWLVGTHDDLEAIAEFIGRHSPANAVLFIARIVEAAERLSISPRRGRVVPEVGDETIRELLFQNYRIVYLIMDERVIIIAVVHAAMDLTTLISSREWDIT